MNTTTSSFDFAKTPRHTCFLSDHDPVKAEETIVLEPDPIGPRDRITVVPTIDSVPISLQQDLLSLLAMPSARNTISWRCSVPGGNEQQNETVATATTTTCCKYQHQLRGGQPPPAATVIMPQNNPIQKTSDHTFAPVFSLQSEGCMSPLLFSFMDDVPIQQQHGMTMTPPTTIPHRTTQHEELETPNIESASSPAPSLRISELQHAKWMEFFLGLCDYKMKHGNFKVPVATSSLHQDAALGLWVKRLRHQYKRYQQGKYSSLTPERVELLSSVGFQWQVQDDLWRDRFRQLEEFAQKYGHIRVPLKGSTTGLHNWIKRQRKQYRLFKQGKASTMSPERYEKLRLLGSCFSDDNGSFGY